MKVFYEILVVLHVIGVTAIGWGIFSEVRKSPRGVNVAMLHGASLQVLTGILMVGLHDKTGDEPLSQAALDARNANPVLTTRAPHKLANGTIIDIQRSRGTRDNDYLISREMQKTVNFTGIASVREQDMAMTDGMGAIPERWREHLGTTDVAIIACRKILLRLARDLQQGKEPYAASHGDAYRVRPVDILSNESDFITLYEKHFDLSLGQV